MRCYLRPQNIQAISFDLDDTLYDNQPYILNAEAELTQFLHRAFPLTQGMASLRLAKVEITTSAANS